MTQEATRNEIQSIVFEIADVIDALKSANGSIGQAVIEERIDQSDYDEWSSDYAMRRLNKIRSRLQRASEPL